MLEGLEAQTTSEVRLSDPQIMNLLKMNPYSLVYCANG